MYTYVHIYIYKYIYIYIYMQLYVCIMHPDTLISFHTPSKRTLSPTWLWRVTLLWIYLYIYREREIEFQYSISICIHHLLCNTCYRLPNCLLITYAHDMGQAHAMGDLWAQDQGPWRCQPQSPSSPAPWVLGPRLMCPMDRPWHGLGPCHGYRKSRAIDRQCVTGIA